jgi:HEAT repeat protein
MLLWAFNPHNPYGYYILLRWVCCGVFAYLAFQAVSRRKIGWAWVFGISAVVYNPIIRVHLTRGMWEVVNVATLGVLAVSVWALWPRRTPQAVDRQSESPAVLLQPKPNPTENAPVRRSTQKDQDALSGTLSARKTELPERPAGQYPPLLGRTSGSTGSRPLDGKKYPQMMALRLRNVAKGNTFVREVIASTDDSSDSRMCDRVLEALLNDLAENEDCNKRSLAADALGQVKDIRTIRPLIGILEDGRPGRRQAAEALGRIGDQKAVNPLMKIMARQLSLAFFDEDLCEGTAWALGEIGDPLSVEVLADAVWRRCSVTATCWLSAEALGKIKDPRVVPLLTKVLRTRWASDGEELYENKREHAAKVTHLRRSVAWALSEIGAPSVDLLIESLRDENYKVRGYAVWALGKARDVRAVVPLTKIMKEDVSREVRARATYALGELSDLQTDDIECTR